MKVYRNNYTELGQSHGFEWFTSKASAEEGRRIFLSVAGETFEADTKEFDISLTKDEVLRALKKFASHPDNG